MSKLNLNLSKERFSKLPKKERDKHMGIVVDHIMDDEVFMFMGIKTVKGDDGKDKTEVKMISNGPMKVIGNAIQEAVITNLTSDAIEVPTLFTVPIARLTLVNARFREFFREVSNELFRKININNHGQKKS